MEYTIPVITRLHDNKDGGYTMYVYNTQEEMLADHPLSEDGEHELTQEEKNSILYEDDPYENGYLGKDTISVNIDEQGHAQLTGRLRFHAGQ